MATKKKLSIAEIRIQKDFIDLENMSNIKVVFPNANDTLHFNIRIKPQVGFYANHNFDFKFDIPEEWPMISPSISIITKIWHPNIDEEGNVCLNILKSDYKPTYTIKNFVQGLEFLLLNPNPYSPLNDAAAEMLIQDKEGFLEKANEYMDEFCPCD